MSHLPQKAHGWQPWVLASVLLLATTAARAQFDPAPSTQPDAADARKAQLKSDAQAWTEKNAAQYANDPDYAVKPDLLVDRKRRIVTLKGYSTGLSGKEPIEFFLISPTSGKGYEALAVSLALPSDIHAALESIGLPAGRPVSYPKMRFWPKGERVKVTFSWDEKNPDGTVSKRRARAEEMLVDRATNQPLAPTGLVFVGSTRIDGDAPSDPKRYYADVADPGSLASTYNEATTVLDVPAQARQSAVYQSRVVNPAYRLPAATPLEITLEPEHPQGPRVEDVALAVTGPSLKDAAYALDAQQNLTGDQMLATLEKHVADGHEPYVTVTPADTLPLQSVKSLYALLETLEDKGIRLEPPAPGQLFHEAFSPEESFRDYKKRTWQPIEIHLGPDGKATLVDIAESDEGPAHLTPRKTEAPTPEALAKLLRDRADQRRPYAVYAPATMTYGALRHWLAASLTDDAVVWVYLE